MDLVGSWTMDELVKRMTIDERLDSYRSFFDHKWAEQLMYRTAGTAIDPLYFDLCVAWRGIANTFALPYLTVTMVQGYSHGLSKSHEPFGTKWIGATRDKLVARMGDSLNHMKQKKLQTVLTDIYHETRSAVDGYEPEFDPNELWEGLIDKYEMVAAIWGSQRLAYGALYYSYEDFITRCIKIQFKKTHYRLKRGEEAEKEFIKAFGEDACKHCWADKAVEIARETRHALVHNGGRETDFLRSLKHGIHVGDDKELHLMAPHVRELHDLLKDRVTHLVRVMLPDPES